MKQRGDKIEI